jgi:hypothetical protein
MRRLLRTPALHPTQAIQHRRRLDVANRNAAQPGKHILLQPDARAFGMTIAHLRGMDGRQPVPRDGLERARRGQAGLGIGLVLPPALHLRLLLLAGVARVGAFGHQAARLLALPACQSKAGVGVGAEAQRLALAVDAVVQAPAVGAALDEQEQVQAVAVGDALARIAGLDRPQGNVAAPGTAIMRLLRKFLHQGPALSGWRRTLVNRFAA